MGNATALHYTPLHVGLELEGQTFEKPRPGPEFKHGVEGVFGEEEAEFHPVLEPYALFSCCRLA
jgi:hypothetical protein